MSALKTKIHVNTEFSPELHLNQTQSTGSYQITEVKQRWI